MHQFVIKKKTNKKNIWHSSHWSAASASPCFSFYVTSAVILCGASRERVNNWREQKHTNLWTHCCCIISDSTEEIYPFDKPVKRTAFGFIRRNMPRRKVKEDARIAQSPQRGLTLNAKLNVYLHSRKKIVCFQLLYWNFLSTLLAANILSHENWKMPKSRRNGVF